MKRAAGALVLATLTLGCVMVSAPVIPPVALVQTYQAPLDLDHQETPLGSKRGTSQAQTILGVVTWGDAGTHAAAQAGGISTIRSADYEFFTVLGVYSKYTTIVYGD